MYKTGDDKNNNKEGRLFSFFSPSRSRSAGLTKEQTKFNGKYNIPNFFIFLKNRFGDLTILNLIFVLANFSLLLVFFATSGNTNVTVSTPASPFYQQIAGASRYGSGAELSSLFSVYSSMTSLSVWTVWTKILYYSSFTLIITFGLSNLGMAYVTRAMVRREHVFVWHDFWYAIKRDWKQGLIVGVLDCILIFLISYALIFYYANLSAGGFQIQLMFYLTIFFALFYLVMRFYIYLMVITFKLKTTKIFKNAIIFAFLGMKRNLCALIAFAVIVFVSIYLILMFSTVAMLLPFIFTFALLFFVGSYCAYPVIVKYMIEPNGENGSASGENASNADEAPIFTDRG